MSVKTILIAHPSAALRERLASALTHARHAAVTAESAAEVRAALRRPEATDLAVIDLGLAEDGVDFIREMVASAPGLPIVVFAGSVSSAAQIASLASAGVSGYLNEHARPEHVMQALAPHLFPHSFNRRASARIEVGLPVEVRADQGPARATTQDLSKGGLAIRTMNPLPVGTPIRVTLRLPGGASDIDAEGRVVWSDRRVGMGVQFEQLSPDAQQEIDGFVDSST